MEQLIFFAVIIVLSILESIARSRKAKRQRESGEAPDEPEQFEWAQRAPWEVEPERHDKPAPAPPLPSYDEELSYDDRVTHDEVATREEVRGAPEASPRDAAADVWAEISGLAAGRVPQRPSRAPVPQYTPARPSPQARRPAAQPPRETRVSAPIPRPRKVDEHQVHLSHLGFGTDPSERPPSEQDVLYLIGEPVNPDARWARAQLRGSPASLRRAVILQEVLGPPACLRESPGVREV